MSFKDFHIYGPLTVQHKTNIRCNNGNCRGFRASELENCIICGFGPNQCIPWNRAPETPEEKAFALAHIGVTGTKALDAIDPEYQIAIPLKFNREYEIKQLKELGVELNLNPKVEVPEGSVKPVKKLTAKQIAKQKLMEDVKKNVAARRRARGQDD